MYVLCYEGGGKLVMIHILFLKGAGVLDFQFIFSPYHHEEYDLDRRCFSMTVVRSEGVREPRVRNTVAAAQQIINMAIME